MNREEHLLVCLIEEAAEIQKNVTKALRFGLDDSEPGTITKNRIKISNEVMDLIAVVELLEEEEILPPKSDIREIDRKKERVKNYMEYATQTGALNNQPNRD